MLYEQLVIQEKCIDGSGNSWLCPTRAVRVSCGEHVIYIIPNCPDHEQADLDVWDSSQPWFSEFYKRYEVSE